MSLVLLGVVLAAYSLTWYFVIRSTRIIEKINKSEFRTSRDIVNHLKL